MREASPRVVFFAIADEDEIGGEKKRKVCLCSQLVSRAMDPSSPSTHTFIHRSFALVCSRHSLG